MSPWLARKDADWWIDKLYDFVRELGATTIHTAISRTVIDVNRDPSGVSLYPGQDTTELVPSTTFDGEPLWQPGMAPDAAEIERRKAAYFEPYHAALAAEIARLRARHPRVVLYDCHSIRSIIPRLFPGELPVMNIGTNAGASCDMDLAEPIAAIASAQPVLRRHQRPLQGRLHHAPLRQARAAACTPCRWSWPAAATCASPSARSTRATGRCRSIAAFAADIRATLRAILEACLRFAEDGNSRPCMTRIDNARSIRAPRGTELSAKSWLTEAPLRMLMNNLDPEVAEKPGELVVYGGIGRAARDWESFDRIVASLRKLDGDQTLLVQSGKPVGVFRTHADAPRVLIANSNIVPHWATLEHFNELDRKGLMMYGQMTAGSWIYIGSQGIVQGTYETFVEMGRRHYGGSLAGKWILTAGLGGMGGAQPLAAVMAGASMLAVECQPSRIEMRLRTGYLDAQAKSLDEALAMIEQSCREKKPLSVGLLGNAAEIFPGAGAARRAARRGDRPDLGARPDQRLSAEGLVAGRLGEPAQRRSQRRRAGGQALDGRARARHAGVPQARHSHRRLRQQHPPDGARTRAWPTPSTSRASCRPTSARCSAAASARSAGRRCRAIPRTSIRTDAKVKELLPDNAHLHNWLDMARTRIKFQGLPARICWVGLGDRHRLGLAFNEMVAKRRAEGAHRHRPRSPGLRLGRQPQSRDRSHARRLGCRVRLAAAQRAAELRVRRHLGVDPSRRRRRHRLLAARRHGGRLRRHGRRRAAHRARAVERSRPPA